MSPGCAVTGHSRPPAQRAGSLLSALQYPPKIIFVPESTLHSVERRKMPNAAAFFSRLLQLYYAMRPSVRRYDTSVNCVIDEYLGPIFRSVLGLLQTLCSFHRCSPIVYFMFHSEDSRRQSCR